MRVAIPAPMAPSPMKPTNSCADMFARDEVVTDAALPRLVTFMLGTTCKRRREAGSSRRAEGFVPTGFHVGVKLSSAKTLRQKAAKSDARSSCIP